MSLSRRLAEIERRMNKRRAGAGSTDDSDDDDDGADSPPRSAVSVGGGRGAASALPPTAAFFSRPAGGYERPAAKLPRNELRPPIDATHNNSVTGPDPALLQSRHSGRRQGARESGASALHRQNASLDASQLNTARAPNNALPPSRHASTAGSSGNSGSFERPRSRLLTDASSQMGAAPKPRADIMAPAGHRPVSVSQQQLDDVPEDERPPSSAESSPVGPLPPLAPPHQLAQRTANSGSALKGRFLKPPPHNQQPARPPSSTSNSMPLTGTSRQRPSGTATSTSTVAAAAENGGGGGTRPASVRAQSHSASSSATSEVAVGGRGDELVVNGVRYGVLNLLGKGGSSKVYQVHDGRDASVKAVKVVDMSDGAAVQQAYFNEVDLLRRLQDSKRVVKLFDSEHVATEQKLLLVMEKGECDLATTIGKHKESERMCTVAVQFFWVEMLKCVKVIHDMGIVHSDLKPANFLNCGGMLKLIDFGIASSVPDGRTSVTRHCLMGTLSYMSPEVLTAVGGDGRSARVPLKADVWSLGCILYNMVYGRLPFANYFNQWARLRAITDPAVNIDFADTGDADLLHVLMQCLARDVARRPSVDELLRHPYIAKSKQQEGQGRTPVRPSALSEASLLRLCESLQGKSPGTMQRTLWTAIDKR